MPDFEREKAIVVGGSAGMGRQAAVNVVENGGSAVIIGRSKARVDDTVAELRSRGGEASGIAAELTDRSAVSDVQRALSESARGRDTARQRCRILRPQGISRLRRAVL